MNLLYLAIYSAVSAVAAVYLYAVANRSNRPIYGDQRADLKPRIHRTAAFISLSVGVLMALLQSFAVFDLLGLTLVTLTTVVTFVVVVSFYTDHRFRMVDRVLLRVAILIAICFGALRLIELQSESKTVLYLVAIILSFAVMFLPSMGASDARAFVLLFAAGIPMLDLIYTYYAFIGGMVLWVGYGLISAIAAKSFKVSIPMVPYILLPVPLIALGVSIYYSIPELLASIQ